MKPEKQRKILTRITPPNNNKSVSQKNIFLFRNNIKNTKILTKITPKQLSKLPSRQIIKQKELIINEYKKYQPKQFKVNQSKTTNLLKNRRPNKIISGEDVQRIMEIKGKGKGKILIMIACGPSVNEVDFSPIIGKPNIEIMVINKPLREVWPPNYWAFCDMSQYRRNKEVFDHFNSGLLITSTCIPKYKPNQVRIFGKHGMGVSHNLTEGYIVGRSSVYANLQVAFWMGFEKIFIFGLDMTKVGDNLHHYGVNPDVDPKLRLERFANEAKNYDKMTEILGEKAKNIYVCSSYNPWPFADKFARLDHKKAIDFISDISKSI